MRAHDKDESLTPARAYLDHNATTPLHPAARSAMVAAFETYGNPSSRHGEGRAARIVIEDARRAVGALTGCRPEDVIFTSCGTEALNIALSPDLHLDGSACDLLLVGAGEHPAVLKGHRFRDAVETIALDANGVFDLEALAAALARHGGKRVMLAIQAVNNETGVIQPVRAAADIVHAAGGLVVCDAVQAVGKIACDINQFGADAMAVSAHKFGGPKGVGALCFGPARTHINRGVVQGGGHERGLSAGTENTIGIAGFGAVCAAVEERRIHDECRLRAWRSAIEAIVREAAPSAVVFGQAAQRVSNTVCFAVPGYEAQTLLMNLDLGGVAVSAGSACASGRVAPSHVLAAMGVTPAVAAGAVRVSMGWTTCADDIDAFATVFAKALKTMRPRVAA
jgi:cysteine desulfurase